MYANAAFLRLSGIPADRVLGSGFSSVAVSQTMDGDAKPILLSDCMVSSCSGNHKKLRLVRNQDEEKQEPVERYAKVVPIVSKRPVHGAEVSNVTHYSIELICDQDNSDELADSLSSLTKGNMSQIKRQSHGSGMAVGVMG